MAVRLPLRFTGPVLLGGVAFALAGLFCVGAVPLERRAAEESADEPVRDEESELSSDLSDRLNEAPEVLAPMVIMERRNIDLRTPLDRLMWEMYFDWNTRFGWPGGGDRLFTPGRIPQVRKWVAASTIVHSGKSLLRPPVSPRYSEFDPTGVTRNIADGGGRGLALRDGVPLNDAFDDEVNWSEAPCEGLDRIEAVPYGGAAAWGNSGGGVIQLLTVPPGWKKLTVPVTVVGHDGNSRVKTKEIIVGQGEVAAIVGDREARSIQFLSDRPTRFGVLQLRGRDFSTAGSPVLAAADRGVADIPAWRRHRWLEARWRQRLSKNMELLTTVRGSEESQNYGTEIQRGDARGAFVSAALAARLPDGFAWNGVVYAEERSRATTFSAVDDSRVVDTPLIEHVARPVRAFGVNWTGRWLHYGNAQTGIGGDARIVRAKLNSRFAYRDDGFTREFLAHGEQQDLGVFVSHERPLGGGVRVIGAARMDRVDAATGPQFVTERRSGALITSAGAMNRTDTVFSPSLGLVWQPSKKWRLATNAQEAFRAPTLAERLQTTGRNAVIIQPATTLRVERDSSVEVTAEYSPAATLTLKVAGVTSDMSDVLAEVASRARSDDLVQLGALPIGYMLRRRANLERVRMQGVRVAARWIPVSAFSVDVGIAINEATIVRAGSLTGLIDREFAASVPRVAHIDLGWSVTGKLTVRGSVRCVGRRYSDNDNTLRLRAAAVANLGVTYTLSERTGIFLTIENLGDAEIVTDRTATGVTYIGALVPSRPEFGGPGKGGELRLSPAVQSDRGLHRYDGFIKWVENCRFDSFTGR